MNVATECTCPLYHGIQMGRNILCPIHGDATEPMCLCEYDIAPDDGWDRQTNPLCPIHGDVRDTGIIELCDLCGRPLPTGTLWVHTECADAEAAQS